MQRTRKRGEFLRGCVQFGFVLFVVLTGFAAFAIFQNFRAENSPYQYFAPVGWIGILGLALFVARRDPSKTQGCTIEFPIVDLHSFEDTGDAMSAENFAYIHFEARSRGWEWEPTDLPIGEGSEFRWISKLDPKTQIHAGGYPLEPDFANKWKDYQTATTEEFQEHVGPRAKLKHRTLTVEDRDAFEVEALNPPGFGPPEAAYGLWIDMGGTHVARVIAECGRQDLLKPLAAGFNTIADSIMVGSGRAPSLFED